MNRPFSALPPFLCLLAACALLGQCTRSQLFPEYTPLCAGRSPEEGLARPDEARTAARRVYHTGPKGGVYYINDQQKKVYVSSRKRR